MDVYISVIMLIMVVWFVYRRFAPVKGLRQLDAETFRKESKGERIIDVREAYEFKQARIPGAINIPLSELPARLAEIPRERPVFLYCRSGMRSKQAAKILIRNGYRDVAHLRGGILAWRKPLIK